MVLDTWISSPYILPPCSLKTAPPLPIAYMGTDDNGNPIENMYFFFLMPI